MTEIVVLLFAGGLLAGVTGALAYVHEQRTQQERNHPRYRGGRRDLR